MGSWLAPREMPGGFEGSGGNWEGCYTRSPCGSKVVALAHPVLGALGQVHPSYSLWGASDGDKGPMDLTHSGPQRLLPGQEDHLRGFQLSFCIEAVTNHAISRLKV